MTDAWPPMVQCPHPTRRVQPKATPPSPAAGRSVEARHRRDRASRQSSAAPARSRRASSSEAAALPPKRSASSAGSWWAWSATGTKVKDKACGPKRGDDRIRILVGQDAEDDVLRTMVVEQVRPAPSPPPTLCAPSTQVCAVPLKRTRRQLLETRRPLRGGSPLKNEARPTGSAVLALEHLPGEVRRSGPDARPAMTDRSVESIAQSRPSQIDGGSALFGGALDRILGLAAPAPRTTSGTPGLGDAGLLGGDLREARAEELLMVEAERGDAADQRPLDDVGRVEPAAEPDLDDAGVGGRSRESEEGGGGGHLEEAGVDAVAGVEHLAEQRRPARRPRSACRRCGCAR